MRWPFKADKLCRRRPRRSEQKTLLPHVRILQLLDWYTSDIPAARAPNQTWSAVPIARAAAYFAGPRADYPPV